jgi:hypothetical protein
MSRLFQFFELPMPDSARLSDFYPANYHSFDSNKTLGKLKQIRRPLFFAIPSWSKWASEIRSVTRKHLGAGKVFQSLCRERASHPSLRQGYRA